VTIQINMPHDSSARYRSTGSPDDRKDMQILNDSEMFKRARFWFWPIVFGVTLFFGLFDGIKGAFVGFLYGVAGGLFFLHESMRAYKK
jgi:hypothetical protein